MKRILVFLAITFALTWGYEFMVVYPLVEGDLSKGGSMTTMLAVGAAMFFPAIGVVLTRLVTHEGFGHCVIKPYPRRKSLPWFLVAWFGPGVFAALGALLYFVLFPGDFDPQATNFVQTLQTQMAAAGQTSAPPANVETLVLVQVVVGIVLGPALNIFTTFGEEWGWRGYLMPKMAHRLRIVPTMLLTGVIWGLWHAPITALGHNYGVGYPGWPFTGILAMSCFCTVCGIFLSYVTIRTGSCLAAAFGHGALNALANAPTMFAVAGVNPFVGPAPTGIIGGAAFVVVAAVMLWDLWRRERAGTLVVPQAGWA